MNYLGFFFFVLGSVSYGQSSVHSSGANLSGTGSISYSVGQLTVVSTTGTGSLLNGVQIAKEQFVLGVDDFLSISSAALVYPNPTKANTTLLLPSTSTNVSYRLLSSQGALLLNKEVHSTETIIATSSLSSGVYYLQVIDENNTSKTFKIIKQ